MPWLLLNTQHGTLKHLADQISAKPFNGGEWCKHNLIFTSRPSHPGSYDWMVWWPLQQRYNNYLVLSVRNRRTGCWWYVTWTCSINNSHEQDDCRTTVKLAVVTKRYWKTRFLLWKAIIIEATVKGSLVSHQYWSSFPWEITVLSHQSSYSVNDL